jgi:hypothetical protein
MMIAIRKKQPNVRESIIEIWRDRIEEALNDPHPDIPGDQVFDELRTHNRDMANIVERRR